MEDDRHGHVRGGRQRQSAGVNELHFFSEAGLADASGSICIEGFLLGLATGTTCLATCAPVLVPVILGEGQRIRRDALVLVQFLSGRLVGYLLFGLLAWGVGRLLVEAAAYRALIFAATYVVLGTLIWLDQSSVESEFPFTC